MSTIQSTVGLVIGKLGAALVQPLVAEGIFLHGVRDKVQLMESEFRAMQSFLKDADAKQLVDDRVKNWVHDVLLVSYAAEDAIDTFACEIAPLRQGGFAGKLKRYALIFKELIALHKLGSEIERININIRAISDRRSTYGIESITQGAAASSASQVLTDRRQRLASPHFEESDFVGFIAELDSLKNHLTNGEQRLCVVSLVGMGGIGKTTLAKKAYNDGTVKNHFNTHVWVSVSQHYSVKQLLTDIGKCCSGLSVEADANMNDIRLKVREYLKERRYLMVLDDIWEDDAWEALKDAFPDGSNGSRVLLTTRKKDVALNADVRSKPHELPLLKQDESWKLFCKKAFPGHEISCPPDLEQTAREIVKKCQGLPLAIIVMGGLVSRKAPTEWQKVLKSIRWQFTEGQEGISKILSLSYDDLPYSLKPCFLYLGMFPEDVEIPAHRLIQMWAAEGFLQERGDETVEEVGEDILMELIARSMIHVEGRSTSGLIQSCGIHDLLRDLAISKAKEDGFLEIKASGACKGRRVAAHGPVGCYPDLQSSASHLRCVFFAPTGLVLLQSRQEQLLFRRFKLLKVLNLAPWIRKLPGEIGELVHLRYLRCRTESMKSLPPSMVSLRNLQTLYLVCQCDEKIGRLHIPSAVEKMLQRLRHLQIIIYRGGLRKDVLSHNLLDLVRKKALQAFYVEVVTLEHCTESSSVSGLYLIDKNFITNSSSPAVLPPQRPFLKESSLRLFGGLKKLTHLCDFPRNLSTLVLHGSHLEQDPLPWLEKLENLCHLQIQFSAYAGEKMTCSPVGFPRLQFLLLGQLDFLEELIVEEGSLPSLLHLSIDSCEELKVIPEGLKHLTNLKKLEIRGMPPEFTNRLQSEIGEDWHKIQHIPSISISEANLFWPYFLGFSESLFFKNF